MLSLSRLRMMNAIWNWETGRDDLREIDAGAILASVQTSTLTFVNGYQRILTLINAFQEKRRLARRLDQSGSVQSNRHSATAGPTENMQIICHE